jgi:predicted site-specific integrase-resolvase
MKTFINPQESAQLTRVSTWTLHNWFRAGKIKEYKDAKGRRCYDREELLAYLVPKAKEVTT